MSYDLDQAFKDHRCVFKGVQVLGSNMDDGLCWYQNGTNIERTSDFTYHLTVNLETMSELAPIWHIL